MRSNSNCKKILRLGLVLGAALVAPLVVAAESGSKDKVDFSSQIRPIISPKCFHCHGPDESSRKAKLRLDVREESTRQRSDGTYAIKPGDLQASELARRISSQDPDEVMPPPKEGHALTQQEVALLKKWIQQGAPYAGHWAFTKPQRPALPVVKRKSWPKNPIDYFILANLEAAGLKPSPVADRYALIRRLSLDLTGLPPTPQEVERFVKDKSPNAYEKVVDRLLASPAYGERWARMWLDIARYADSAGYGSDPLRLNIWPYRDWVIKAFNSNMPFDQFTIEQLAGDLLENSTEEQRVATAFHRNTMTNTEGGTDDEEWRVAAVKDRANVTGQAWMGLTFGCAQCHSHKFDPITQREYYQFYAFFNQTEDSDKADETPTMPLPTPDERKKMDGLKSEIAELETKINADSPELTEELNAWEKFYGGSNVWSVLVPTEFKATNGTTFTKLDDLSLLAGTNSPDKDKYTVKYHLAMNGATAIRLEALPDASLPSSGPGRGKSGNFVVNHIAAQFKPDEPQPARARFVRIELPGTDKILSLAEVQVLSGTNNLALHGKASQSSVDFDGVASLAIDGNTSGDFERKSTTHTKSEENPWWEVDLGAEYPIDAIAIWNRMGAEVEGRLVNFNVVALDEHRGSVWATKVRAAPKPNVRLNLGAEHEVVLVNPSATYTGKKYDVADAIQDKSKPKQGWTDSPEKGAINIATFEVLGKLSPGEITFELTQEYGARDTLGRFRISATTGPTPVRILPTNIVADLNIAAGSRTPAQETELKTWFRSYSAATASVRRKIDALKVQLDAIQPVAIPVMRELAANQRRVSHLLFKGNYLTPGEEVTPGIPAAFNFWPKNAPTNRLGLALWLLSSENPLTSRVTANRFWAQIFGTGIVETEEDFGTQGTLPSHPELLDWLAVDFREHGWDIKRFLKQIVMSATYQQSARVTSELLQKDPGDRLLSHAPRRRLDAEMIRDQALALSGVLSHKIGGPSVYPPQPDGLWRAAFNGQRTYATSTGEDRYRRGLYTIWRRTVPYPSMATFDAPSRETCTFRRLPTNTPLQAYVTLNDPVYVEAAQALGRRLVHEGGKTVEERIRYGLRLVEARPASATAVKELVDLYNFELQRNRAHEKDAMKLATEPLGPLPKDESAAEAAAWTVVANVLLNLDAVLMKG